jgi:dienelactone hydrolase
LKAIGRSAIFIPNFLKLHTMKRSLLVRTLQVLIAFGGLALITALYFYTKNYGGYFESRRGKLAHVSVVSTGSDSLVEKSWLTVSNTGGLTIECGLLVPRAKHRRYPAIILMGGKRTGKYAVNYALNINNVIFVAPDYPYSPRESYTFTQLLSDVPEIRQALLDMVPSVMLLTDYLWQREDVDTTKLILIGYSFGAPLVPAVVTYDRRAAAAAMVYGGGNLRSLITHNVRRYEGALVSECIGMLGGLLLRPLEPMRYVERIAPTPLIMINGAQDEQIPRENVELLYAKAREPKKLVWLESKHVHPKNVELTKMIVKTLAHELALLGVLDSLTFAGH